MFLLKCPDLNPKKIRFTMIIQKMVAFEFQTKKSKIWGSDYLRRYQKYSHITTWVDR